MRGYSSWLLAKALGTGFSQFVHPVFQRCINIIQIQHLAKVDPASAGVQYDKKFVVCSLDLLSGLTEGLGSEIEGLVRQEISPVVMTVVSSLVPILQHAEGLNKSLIENSSITLGRLAWVCPELVSPHMAHFMQSWCIALSMIRDDIEKEDAFRGLCTMVRANPSGPLSSLTFMCKAIASWHEIRSEELQNEIFQVLLGYKQMLGNGAWEQCMSYLEPPVKEKLSKYQV